MEKSRAFSTVDNSIKTNAGKAIGKIGGTAVIIKASGIITDKIDSRDEDKQIKLGKAKGKSDKEIISDINYRKMERKRKANIITILACLVYILSPVDLLPEAFLFILGLVDDALIILFLLCQLKTNIKRG